MDLPLESPIWIDRPAALQRLADTLSQQTHVAVDTESNSLFAYHEQVCLIQFSTEANDYLVDPLALSDLTPLGPIFENPAIEKIFHAAEYDLICLKRDYQFTFNNLFDTMLAARVLGKNGLGLGTMLEESFGLHVDKRLQRANWARRPLSSEMMTYARMDTHYLIQLHEMLKPQLVEKGRLELAEEDFRRMTRVVPGAHENSSGNCWRISGAQDLTPRQSAVLMELCAFRDARARAADLPAFRILPNQTLIELAQIMPRKRSELNNIFGLSPKLIDRYGAGLLEAVERGITNPPAYRPTQHRPGDDVIWRLDTLRNWRKTTAREIGVESDVILPREMMEAIAHANPHGLEDLNEIMIDLPWRFHHFGREILRTINSY